MRFRFLTLFPEMFDSYFGESVLKRAARNGLVSFEAVDIRDFATDKHQKTDDTPYGGGAGMVMKVEPIYRAIESMRSDARQGDGQFSGETIFSKSGIPNARVILLSAKGNRFSQKDARRLAQCGEIIFICGRYEGVDERVSEYLADEELSVGDFVVTGGELPAMIIADAVSRLIPGVLGNEESAEYESHSREGYREYPQYTKPEIFNGWKVPEVLLSGNHAEIARWRESESKTVT